MQGLLLLSAPQIIDLPLKSDGGQLPLSMKIIDYATFALVLVLELSTSLISTSPTQQHQ